MAKTAFLVDNANRDFPFLAGTSFVPFSAVVGCGFMLGHGTGFVVGEHTVFLDRVVRTQGRFYFYFSSDAPGLVGRHLVFTRNVDDPEFLVEYADPLQQESSSLSTSDSFNSLSDSLSSLSESRDSVAAECDFVDDFAGFIITGPLDALADTLGEDEAITGHSVVEPALLQSLVGTYAKSLNLANGDRTRYEPPAGCPEPDWAIEPEPMYVRATCLTGSIVLVPGYNVIVLQNDFDNSLTISAAVAAGAGEPCEQVPIVDGEVPPEDSIFLEGGPSCADVVRTFAGVSGPLIPLVGGNGVAVEFQPASHAIVLNVDLHNLAICSDELFTADDAEAEANHTSEDISLTAPAALVAGIGIFGVDFHSLGSLLAPPAVLAAAGSFFDLIDGPADLASAPAVVDGTGTFSAAFAGFSPLISPPATAGGAGTFTAQNLAAGSLTAGHALLSGVGASGAMLLYCGRSAVSGRDAEASYFIYSNSVLVRAVGGKNGDASSSPCEGGQATDPDAVGDVKYSGGNGYLVVFPATDGGGGGSSAGPTGDGVSATGTGGASGGSEQGSGSHGQVNPSTPSSPGGGAGGGVDYFESEFNHVHVSPFNGTNGRVRLTFNDSLTTVINRTNSGFQVITPPGGATQVIVETWGAGARGGDGNLNQYGGGGGGGYSRSVIAL